LLDLLAVGLDGGGRITIYLIPLRDAGIGIDLPVDVEIDAGARVFVLRLLKAHTRGDISSLGLSYPAGRAADRCWTRDDVSESELCKNLEILNE
jgi:hypothetical protein